MKRFLYAIGVILACVLFLAVLVLGIVEATE